MTAVAPAKFVPETVTTEPASPLVGVKPVMAGAGGRGVATATSTKDATDGTPEAEIRNSMYRPDGASVPPPGAVTLNVLSSVTLKARSS